MEKEKHGDLKMYCSKTNETPLGYAICLVIITLIFRDNLQTKQTNKTPIGSTGLS